MEYVAVVGQSYWTDEVKYHAADPGSVERDTINRRDVYRSRCGRRNLTQPGRVVAFANVLHLQQCQRCLALTQKDD